MRIRLEDCSPDLKKRIEDAIRKEKAGRHASVPITDMEPPARNEPLAESKVKGKAKITRHKQGEMNKTEAKFLAEHLAGKYPVIMFEALKFRLADNTNYTPDFVTISGDGTLTAWEVKGGFFMDDARVKWKVAAEQYFWLDWKWCTLKNKTAGWKIEEY